MKKILLFLTSIPICSFYGAAQCAPVFVDCPNTIYAGNSQNTCDATVVFNEPSFTGCANGVLYQTSGLPSGSVFPSGITTNTFEVYDEIVYFEEDFADNSAGWILDTEWEIGPAMTSSCGGGSDPGTDNTPTADNGVAGVVIGGCATTALHPFYYLTSPVINTAGAPQVELQFYRWLNSDYTPYMQNSVEVYDGTTWQVI